MIPLQLVLFAIQAAVPGGPVDYRRIDIPLPYHGKWSLDREFCDDTGPAVIVVGSRRFDRGEEHGLLEIANLNYAGDVPELHGRFEMVEGLRFWEETVRLKIEGGKLFVTRTEDPDKPDSAAAWIRCAS